MKYMGSKNRIAKHILPIILENRKAGQYYVEPFLGGCNSIDKVSGPRRGSELNIYVAALLIALRDGWSPPQNVTEAKWYHVKNNKDFYEPYFVGYCGVCLSFGSVWFSAYARDKKKIRNYAEESCRNLLKQAGKLQGLEIYSCSYKDLPIPDKSILYLDPPYEGTDKYRGFDKFNHLSFWDWCRSKSRDGHDLFISEFKAPEDFYMIWRLKIHTVISEKALGKKVIEKLFVPIEQAKRDYPYLF